MYTFFLSSPSKQLRFGMHIGRDEHARSVARGCGTSVAEQRKVIFHPFARPSHARIPGTCTIHICVYMIYMCGERVFIFYPYLQNVRGGCCTPFCVRPRVAIGCRGGVPATIRARRDTEEETEI